MNRKKIAAICLLILLLSLFALTACRGGDGQTETAPAGDTATGAVTDAETEPIPESPLRVWFDYGTGLTPRDNFKEGTAGSISFSMAKNEMEGFELLLAADEDYTGLRCEVEPLSDGKGHDVQQHPVGRHVGRACGCVGLGRGACRGRLAGALNPCDKIGIGRWIHMVLSHS